MWRKDFRAAEPFTSLQVGGAVMHSRLADQQVNTAGTP